MRFTDGMIVGLDTLSKAGQSILTHTGDFHQASYREGEVGCKDVCTSRTMPGTVSFRKNVQCALGY